MSEFSSEQRRNFIALLCRVAWADGVVTEEERDAVTALAAKLAGEALSSVELQGWLDDGPPESEVSSLPEGLGQYFYYEAFKLAEVDGDLANAEVEMLESIVARVFSGHPEGTPIAKIALEKRD